MKIGDKVTCVTEKITVLIEEGSVIDLFSQFVRVKLKNGRSIVVKNKYVSPINKIVI